MDLCQIDGIEELKTTQDVHHDINMKSIRHISIKKNTTESDHRTPKRKSEISNSNTLKKKKKYETALAAIFPENDQSYSQYAQDYAEGYMKKMRERLDSKSFDLATKLLASFSDADANNINLLYHQITEVLTDKNEDLIYEFLGFLLPGQAFSIGKLTDYLELTRIKEFIRKLQVCMKKQPTQVRKILDNLFNLSKTENITSLEVHTAMFPLLKSNPILVDCFFQLIPTEHPPESFFSDDNWEHLDIDQSINCGIDYEEIIPSDSEDHTPLINVCHCLCHKPGDNNTHCRSCGLKFFKGRIYFDTPEGLKLAKINFEGADSSIVKSKIDKTEENVTVKQKNRKSLIKNSSPGSAEDIKGSTGTESEEDLIDVKPKKRQKSKVVQSLKLKFKKEDSPKCKDDQETNYETGKSIVHVTNEELNSSEMVFFCIPNAEPSTKMLPKKKLKVDVKENVIKIEHDFINQVNPETCLMENLNSVNKTNEMNDKEPSNENTVCNVQKEIKTEFNCISLLNLIEKEQNKMYLVNSETCKLKNCNSVDKTYGINIEKSLDISNGQNMLIDTKTDFTCKSPSITMDKIDIKCEQHQMTDVELITSQSLAVNNDLSQNFNSPDNKRLESSDESNKCKTMIKNETILDSVITNKKQCADQNTTADLATNYCTSTSATSGINELLLDGNMKVEAIQHLPPCYVNIQKQENNESEKPLINKWTIDEDKIILQTCKRVEDIEVLLETINRRIPQRSVSEIQERFTTLMTLLEQMIDVKQN